MDSRATIGRRIAVLVALGLLVAGFAYAYAKRHNIYGLVLLSHAAHAAVPDRGSPEQTAFALLDATLRIAPQRRKAIIDDTPAATLIRGWGYCDSAAMAFVQLAERRGLRGQLIFLRRRDGVSTHSVATILLDGEWRVFDVQKAAVSRRRDGELATPADIAARRAPSTAKDVSPDWYRRPEVPYETPDGVSPRGLGIGAVGLLRHVHSALQFLYLRTPPPVYTQTNGRVWEDWKDPADRSFWRARNYEIFGRRDLARAAYREVLAARSPRYAAEARFYLKGLDTPRARPRYRVLGPAPR